MSWKDQVSQSANRFLPERSEIPQMVKKAVIIAFIFLILYIAGHFLPVGFDWEHFFSIGRYPNFWMPWVKPLMEYLNLPAIFAITVLSIGIRSYRYRPSPLAIALALLSLPTLWVLFLGNLDGLAVLGLLLLPFGAPLVLIKPQVAAFALLARKSSIIVSVIWILLSFLIWDFWPQHMLIWFDSDWSVGWQQDIALFPWGIIIAIPLMWFSRGDEDLLMAAGSLGTLHLFPYHFIVLMPALARMKPAWMFITWLVSFTPLLSNWLGPWAWHFGNILSLCFWIGIYTNTNSRPGPGLFPKWIPNDNALE